MLYDTVSLQRKRWAGSLFSLFINMLSGFSDLLHFQLVQSLLGCSLVSFTLSHKTCDQVVISVTIVL